TMARRVGARVVEVKNADSFADIRDIVRQVGDAVGEPQRAAALVGRMDATLAELAAHPPTRRLSVVAWSGGWAVPGKGSLPDASLAGLVVTELRLPRAVLAILVGASLGLSGAVLQGLLRNPLAEPGLLGVSNGAALGAVVSIYFGLEHVFGLATPLLGMVGAIGAGALTFAFGRGSTLTLILAGAAVCSPM